MTVTSLVLIAACLACVLERSVGNNFYWQVNPNGQDLLNYPFLSPVSAVWQPECDDKSNSGSSSSSSSESSESSSSESDSKESKESGESKEGSEEGSKEEASKEEGGSKEETGSKEESGSKEEGESGSKEEKKGSEEKKKEAPKKKKKGGSKSLFPPLAYTFPARQVQRIIYSPASSYAYMPYRSSSYVVQPSYPVKSTYQYVSVPAPATVLGGYGATAPVVNKAYTSPIQKILYASSGLNYPSVSKDVISPGAQVYSAPGFSSIAYIKK